ncbi:SNF2 family N-terminal domain-containing protein [Apiospora arundinis]
MGFEEVTTNHLVYQDSQFLVTDVNALPFPPNGSPTFETQNPDDGPVRAFAESTNPRETAVVQVHGSSNSIITGYDAPKPEFDTCFGTMHIEAPKLHYDESELPMVPEVKLEPLGSHLGIFGVADGKYRGSVSQNAMAPVQVLQSENAVRASFELIFNPPALHVTIYGCRTQAEYIGDSLAASGVFLQVPRRYNESIPYFNPQYLVPPGAEFKPPANIDFDEIPQKVSLDPSQKSRIMQILDETIYPTTLSEVSISDKLKTSLKEYQKVAFAMMVEKERGGIVGNQFPSVWDETETYGYGGRKMYLNNVTGEQMMRRPNPCLGGILADDMGLGKTLTTLALILGSLSCIPPQKTGDPHDPIKSAGTLIVVPLSTLMSWEEQIGKHIKRGSLKYLKYYGQSKSSLKNDLRDYDVVLTTYDTLKRETTEYTNSKGNLKQVRWLRVVLDEAHVIRNRASKVFQAVISLKTKYRWCLTGTPIQNHVQDLGSLVEFLRVDIFADPKRFKAAVVDPIGRNDSEGFQRLKRLFQGVALRRTKHSVMEELKLPLKNTKEQLVELDPEERQLYDLVKNSGALFIRRHQKHGVLQTILKLRQIANHGRELVPAELIQKVDRLGRGALEDLAADACENCGITIKQEDAEEQLASVDCMHQICTSCCSVTTEITLTAGTCPLCSDNSAPIPSKKKNKSRSQQAKDKSTSPYKPSSKVKALLRNLEADRTDVRQHDDGKPCKSVVFSCWAGMLDLVDRALDDVGIGHVRVDGAVAETARRQAVDKFRKDDSVTVLLATIGTAGVGLDLTVASQVHLMEPQWNPMVEKQAVDRVFRLGQTRDVLAISYIMSGKDSVDQVITHLCRVPQINLQFLTISFQYILQTQKRKLNLVEICVDGTDSEGIAESASRWVESITNISQEQIREEDADMDMIC